MKAIVIGCGIVGSAVAWRLAKSGIEVEAIDRSRLGSEASWAAAGMLAPQAEAEGPGAFLDLCVRAQQAFEAIQGDLRKESGTDFEYERAGVLYVALDSEEQRELESRAAWQRAAGLEVRELTGDEVRKLEPTISPQVRYGLHFPSDGRADNRKLTEAFIRAARGAGVKFHENVCVEEVLSTNHRATGVRLADGSKHEAEIIVNAAGAWAGRLRGIEQDRVDLRPVRGQILCFETKPRSIRHSLFSLRGYLVPRRDGRLIAGSTREEAGYSKIVTLGGMARIASGAVAMIPELQGIPFREGWAGLRPATRDHLPVLGPSPSLRGLYYAVGHFRSGILLAALSAEIIEALVAGRDPGLDLESFLAVRFAKSNR